MEVKDIKAIGRPLDHERMCDQAQQIVATEQGHPRAISLIDESGNPKKGPESREIFSRIYPTKRAPLSRQRRRTRSDGLGS